MSLRYVAIPVALLCAAVTAQPAPVPSEQELVRHRAAVLDALTDLAVERVGTDGDQLVELLLAEAHSQHDPARRYLILHQALRAARKTGGLPIAMRTVEALARHFAVDAFALRTATLAALENRASVPRIAVVLEYLALADTHLEATSEARLRAATRAARDCAARSGDSVLTAWTERRCRELAAMRTAWKQVADAAANSAERGEYLCYYRNDWDRGRELLAEPATLRYISKAKGGETVDGVTALRIAEHWRGLAESQPQPIARRNLRRRALRWFRAAWSQLEGPEQVRVVRQMDRLEDHLAREPGPGRLRTAEDDALQQLIISDGEWRVEDGRLFGRNTGDATRATHRYAFRRIDSVTIRGGIQSSQGLNLRIAVGAANLLFNWEALPESHFYLGEHRAATGPRLLQQGREHDIRIRQLGANVVVFVDGEPVFSGAGQLSGTVCVYPALSSEIFVTELSVEGEIDPLTRVTEPVGHVR